jgi:MFS family permease
MDSPGPSYRATLAVPGFGRLMGASLLGRGAEAMLNVVMVLFVLQRFRSPALAGVTVFAFIGPGLLLSPLAGALLDRYGRVRLIELDYVVGAAALAAIAALSWSGRLSAALLVSLALVGGVTGILSAAGVRSVVPLVLPEHLWGRGNAVDSAGYTVTILVGPALGGLVVGLLGPEAGMVAVALLLVAGALSLVGVAEPGSVDEGGVGSLLRSAMAGVRYVLTHPVLRGIATSMGALNVGAGIMVVAMPVLALRQFGASSFIVGGLWAVQGFGGAGAGFVFGRVRTRGREKRIMLLALLGTALATGLMAVAPNLLVLALGSLGVGLVTGPFDVTLFSLRQRVTGARWLGRAIAVSMSFNYIGFPVGSAVSGPFIAVSPRFALAVAAGLALTSAAVAVVMLRQPAALEERPPLPG